MPVSLQKCVAAPVPRPGFFFMTNLTIKQENFCLSYLETGSASEAYRRAYNAENMKPETVNRAAKELLDNPKITARLDELRKPITDSAQVTLKSHLARLDSLSRQAEERGQFSAAINAEISRGKAAGLYTEKLDHTSSDGSMSPKAVMTPKEIAAELRRQAESMGNDE